MTEHTLKLINTSATVAGVIIALASGWYWYHDYKQRAALEAMQALHQARLEECGVVSEQAAKLFSAADEQEFFRTFTKFEESKHGKALMLLDSKVVRFMLDTYNAARMVETSKAPRYQDKARCVIGNRVFDLVDACREMVANDFKREGGKGIQDLDNGIKMAWDSWSKNDCLISY